ncbi:RecQ family ATP-dependent DNA helicase [Lapidilactobacillus wuchangensis]|uniref:RecQ family ATP-dependent DNA helicase n=1 Tax=Lapidilactobacillus wuchangensis TaxID=2486001 RepID=UPI000F7A94E3|nr:RecQ family ATP-dependent DNA helicase [Lapidilactobacillus wuchangensis]
MPSQLTDELQQRFGFQQFRPGQAEILTALLAGRDAIAVLPTGSGKSLLYQFVAPHLTGLILVVSPLISLMSDQAMRIRTAHIGSVAVLNSQLTPVEKNQILRRLSQYKFLFVAPETLQQPQVQQAIQRVQLALFVVDEAHCISSWGPDFRPSYLLLGQVRQQLKPALTLALTATATPKVFRDIQHELMLPAQTAHYRASVNRSNLFLRLERISHADDKQVRLQALIDLGVPTLIYVATRHQAQALAQYLQLKTNRQVAYYHGGLSGIERYRIQQLFLQDQLGIVVATNAFGMGIDKSNLRLVIHYDLPANFENYLQEIGRAGRDGQLALTVIFVDETDFAKQGQRIKNGQLTTIEIQNFFAHPDDRQELNDSQLGVLAAYAQTQLPVAQVTAILQQTSQLRAQQRQAFWQFLNSRTCLRQQLCDYFDAKPPEIHHDQWCCSQSEDESLSALLQRLPLVETAAADQAPLQSVATVLTALFD